ncbi:MAG: Holliday junction resolvase RuvX [Deltaproteobacteria bacterium]|nr:Holliday junction resolvase RuvX [Deltaproteobacteria bacterium]
MRVLGLDVGSKTIGVAVSDELGLAAHPKATLARKGTRADVESIAKVVADLQVERVVVGLPLTMEGEIGPRAKRVLVFARALKERFGEAVPVETWDERFSTVAVERVLIDADLSRARRKEVIDKQAAAFLLQGWLDARRRPE